MTITRCLTLAFVSTLTLVIGVSTEAQGQVGDDDFDEPEVAAVVVRPQFNIAPETFDQWVFNTTQNATAARSRLESLLTLQIDEIFRTCGLNNAQKAKLNLAGRGDIKRFFDRVEEKRRKFEEVRTDQQKFQAFYQEIQPLQTAIQQGMFADGSFFSKALRSTLQEGQLRNYEKVVNDRVMFRFKAKVDVVVATLDHAAGLNADQRRRLRELILAESRPPKKFGTYDLQVLLLQLSRLPEARLKTLFDDGQWVVVSRQFDNAKRLEPFLSKNGFLPDELRVDGEVAKHEH